MPRQHPDAMTRLRTIVSEQGSQTNAARKLGVTPQLLSLIIRGKAGFSDTMLDKLGLKRLVVQK